MQVMMDHREIFVRPDKYGGLTIQLWWSLYGLIVPTLLLPVTYLMIVVTAFDHNWLNLLIYPMIFIIYRIITTLVSIVIMREWMNPLTAIWYRIINDPLQMYLAVTCWYKVLSGNVQSRGKIWAKIPRQGVPQAESAPATKLVAAGRSPRHQVDGEQVTGPQGTDKSVDGVIGSPDSTAVPRDWFLPVPTASSQEVNDSAR
jgi:hypothetical protein